MKAWNSINRLLIKWKSDLSYKIKRDFFQAITVSILVYGFTPWVLIKRWQNKKKIEETTQECYILSITNPESNTPQNSNLSPISQTIQVRRTRQVLPLLEK